MTLTCLLAGATGYLGTRFTHRFRDRARIIPILRKSSPLSKQSDDVLSFEQLRTARAPFDLDPDQTTLVHLVGCSREVEVGAINRGNVGVTADLVAACERWGVRRIIYVSGFGIPDASQSVYYLSKVRAEELLLASFASVAIVRASYILGGDDELIPRLVREVQRGAVLIPGSGDYHVNPVYVDEIADVMWSLCTTHRTTIGRLNVLGDPVTLRRLLLEVASGLDPDVAVQHESLEVLIREAILSSLPRLSLSELAILVADEYGARTPEVCGVTISPYNELLSLLQRDARTLAYGR